MLLLTCQTLSLDCHECLLISPTSQLWDIHSFSSWLRGGVKQGRKYGLLPYSFKGECERKYTGLPNTWGDRANWKLLWKQLWQWLWTKRKVVFFSKVVRQGWEAMREQIKVDLNQIIGWNLNCIIWLQHLISCGFDILVWSTLVKNECNEKVKNNPKTATGREGVAWGYHKGRWSLGKVSKIIVC